MYEISDVIVLPADEEILKRYRFSEEIYEEVVDIARMILESKDGWQLQNQLDDAENFKMHGEKYNQRVYFILGACRLLWNEEWIRKAVKEIFTVQNTPTMCSDADDVEAFIARMTKCVMQSEDLDQVCKYLFDYYMGQRLFGYDLEDKIIRTTRMKIARGRKLDNDFNHKKVQIEIPELKSCDTTTYVSDIDQEPLQETGSYDLASGEASDGDCYCNDKDVQKWMNYSEDSGLGEEWKKILGF